MVPTYFFTSVVFKLFVFLCVFSKRKKRSLSSACYYYLNPVLTTAQIIRWSFHFLVSFAKRARARGRAVVNLLSSLNHHVVRRGRGGGRGDWPGACFWSLSFSNRNRFLAKSRARSPIVLVAFSRISRVSFLNRDDARGDVIAKGEAGCLAQWCANGLEASRIVARAV